MRLSRFALCAVSMLVAVNAFAAADIFLQIPGVSGGSNRKGREGWSEVQAHSLNLLPAIQDGTKKNSPLVSQCSAVIAAFFGAGGPATAQLIGIPVVGDILIEAEQPSTGVTFYRAALKGAVITRDSVAQSDTVRSELSLNFTKVVITYIPQSDNGKPGAPETGIFDCMRP